MTTPSDFSQSADRAEPANPDEIVTRAAEGPDVILRYADHADALIDVFLPASLGRPGSPLQLIVLLHGGFWRAGYDRTHLRPLANALTARGYVVATPEYRRVGEGGGWPTTAYDVEAALAALPSLLDSTVPGWVHAATPYVMSGHSAGGHLALWAGLRAGPRRIASIVALAPVSDLRYAASARMGNGAVIDLMGGGPDQLLDAYAEADALALLTGDVPVTIIQGTNDAQVAVEMNRAVAADHADKPGLRYVELPGVDHFALIDPLSTIFESTVLPALSTASVHSERWVISRCGPWAGGDGRAGSAG
ncbi:MAG: alpha/beta hydrolase family protein [Nocardioidaceae bacterium]